MSSGKLYIIDGNAYLYRAYYALPRLTNSKGLLINAVYGFTRMLLKIIKQEKPYYLAVCFDSPMPTFRHEEFAEYKAHRPPTPEDLKEQMPLSRQVVEALDIYWIEKDGYEADDLIATLAKKAKKEDIHTVIVSSDKDLLQLVDETIQVLDESKGILYDLEKVKHVFGIEPKQIVDLLGLAGDSADNIPGVPGIGIKTATALIKEFESIENLLKNASLVKGKTGEKIRKFPEMMQTGKKLAKLIEDIPIPVKIEDCKLKEFDQDKFLKILKELEFKKLISEFIKDTKFDNNKYKIILSEEDFEDLLRNIEREKKFVFNIETTNVSPLKTRIIGFSFSIKDCGSFYIPVGHDYSDCVKQLQETWVLEKLKTVLEDYHIKKYGHDLKYHLIVLKERGINFAGIDFDTMIAAYLIDPSRQGYELKDIVMDYLSYKIASLNDVVNKGEKEKAINKVHIEKAAEYAGGNVFFVLQLVGLLSAQLKDKILEDLFYKIEMPLIEVLAEMQIKGIQIDVNYLRCLGLELQKEKEKLETEIYAQSGEEFNINSPKQLAVILFEKLKLPVIKKTKTGISTAEETLNELSFFNKLPALILKYREVQKINSTYVEALVRIADSETGRIHSYFNQTVTATGRLSSSEPNLQNIPVQGEIGKKIRKAFIAKDGWCLVAADYSQIDLRVLAHLSGDENLNQAFCAGRDVHSQTASEIFNIPEDSVSTEMRKLAKTINFGIIYGMSAYGLSTELKIKPFQAQDYINRYFNKYKGVKEYIDTTLKEATENGYVTTLFNRRRYIAEIRSKNNNLKKFAERVAINTPVQGTSADIIKIAMVHIGRELKERKLESAMLLQIHDELIFEVPIKEKELLIEMVKEKMENAVKLNVPVLVNIKTGKAWSELE